MHTQISARVARTLAALDHGAPDADAFVDAVPPSVRRVAVSMPPEFSSERPK